jgi:hypothetical protein
MSRVDSETRAIFNISPGTWVSIVLLIVTVSGYGFIAYANNQEIKDQAVEIDKKADEAEVDRRHQEVLDRVKDMSRDVRELRKIIIDDMRRHGHAPQPDDTDRYRGD